MLAKLDGMPPYCCNLVVLSIQVFGLTVDMLFAACLSILTTPFTILPALVYELQKQAVTSFPLRRCHIH